MNTTMNVEKLEVPGCIKTTVRKLHEERGLHILCVEVEPGGEIPLHTHACAASMVVVEGSARTLGKDGRIVKKGDVVTKTALEPHGFTNINERFSFISIADADGILLPAGWDLEYTSKLVRLRAAGASVVHNADFADCLIERSANEAGCGYTATIDRDAVKNSGMRLIG